jgi:hypothetical protein
MKNSRTVLAFMAVALLMIPAVGNAEVVEYDFLTTATITVDGGSPLVVNNANLSLIVDWTTVDYGGPVTAAEGEILSIVASISSDATNSSGEPAENIFGTAILNDDTPSTLVPYFSTRGFDTTHVADAEAELSALGTSYFDFTNAITVTDPFGLNPIFGGPFIVGTAVLMDLATTTYTEQYTDYSFAMDADGTGEVYAFTETVFNSYYFEDLSDPTIFDFGWESVQISYQLGQLQPPTVVPEPATATFVGLGLAVLTLRRVRASRHGTQ